MMKRLIVRSPVLLGIMFASVLAFAQTGENEGREDNSSQAAEPAADVGDKADRGDDSGAIKEDQSPMEAPEQADGNGGGTGDGGR